MSGGSMDYLYGRVEDAQFKLDTPLRRAFKKHLSLVSSALRAIEWNDSGDGDPTEDETILACLPSEARFKQAIDEAKAAVAEVGKAWAVVKSDMKKGKASTTWTVEGPNS
jgi:hypothetical protein